MPGQPILFKAWRQLTNRGSNISSEGRYLLGAGIWGENGGLTILDRVALQRAVSMAATPWPDSLTVTVDAAAPFRDSLSIRIGLPADMDIQLAIYDLMGRRQALLHDGLTGRGYHIVTWDGRDDRGSPVRNGMHFLQVRTPTRTITRKLLLMR